MPGLGPAQLSLLQIGQTRSLTQVPESLSEWTRNQVARELIFRETDGRNVLIGQLPSRDLSRAEVNDRERAADERLGAGLGREHDV